MELFVNTNRPLPIKDIIANGKSLVKNRVADLTEVIGIGGGNSGSITIDTSMSDTSVNTVQNKVIKAYVDDNKVTKTSELTNDSNYITTSTANENYAEKSHTHTKSQISDFPTNVSAFNNDEGYLKQHQSLTDYVKKADVYTKTETDNKLSEKANTTDLATKQDKITSTTSTDTSITLKPNTNIDIITESATTITVAIPTDTSIINEYSCTINTTTDTDVTIALADTTKTIVWDNTPSFEKGRMYEISIRYTSSGYFGLSHSWEIQ